MYWRPARILENAPLIRGGDMYAKYEGIFFSAACRVEDNHRRRQEKFINSEISRIDLSSP